jgi:ribosome recycling factor
VGNTTALLDYRTQVETALRKVDVLCQSAAYMNQMAGTTANGLANPPTPEAKGKAAEIAVAAAQYKINVTRTNLTASRDAYMQVSQERRHQQSQITRTIAEMTRVDLENVRLTGMRSFVKQWQPRLISPDAIQR